MIFCYKVTMSCTSMISNNYFTEEATNYRGQSSTDNGVVVTVNKRNASFYLFINIVIVGKLWRG